MKITAISLIFLCIFAPLFGEDTKLRALEAAARESPQSAEAHAALGAEYHWRKDFARAERAYQTAASLDPRYTWTLVPLWDEQKKWDAIISLTNQGAEWASLPASVLGPLATAFREKGRTFQLGLVIEELERRKSTGEEDYRNYVLAYVYLWDDQPKKSLERLKLIKRSDFLRYACTQSKFDKLRQNPEFIQLCDHSSK